MKRSDELLEKVCRSINTFQKRMLEWQVDFDDKDAAKKASDAEKELYIVYNECVPHLNEILKAKR